MYIDIAQQLLDGVRGVVSPAGDSWPDLRRKRKKNGKKTKLETSDRRKKANKKFFKQLNKKKGN